MDADIALYKTVLLVNWKNIVADSFRVDAIAISDQKAVGTIRPASKHVIKIFNAAPYPLSSQAIFDLLIENGILEKNAGHVRLSTKSAVEYLSGNPAKENIIAKIKKKRSTTLKAAKARKEKMHADKMNLIAKKEPTTQDNMQKSIHLKTITNLSENKDIRVAYDILNDQIQITFPIFRTRNKLIFSKNQFIERTNENKFKMHLNDQSVIISTEEASISITKMLLHQLTKIFGGEKSS